MPRKIYDPTRHPLLARALARDGLVDKEIARALGIGVRTFHEWKKAHPELVEALREGKDEVDVKVENSLLRRALGFDYEETEAIVQRFPEGKDGTMKEKVTRVKKTKKHIAPDVVACIFWLKNRRPDIWRDRHEIGGPGGGAIPVKLYDFDQSGYPNPQPAGDGK